MKHKILILDDDQATLDVLKEALGLENMDVSVCSGSADFFNKLSEYKPDLVVIDYLLDGINGGEICHQIKSSKQTSGLPVIIMSAYPRVFESIGDYNCDAFVAKPFDLFKLIDTIKVFLLSSKMGNAELVV